MFEINFIDSNDDQSQSPPNPLSKDLNETYWNILGNFSRITRFFKDSANQVKGTINQKTPRNLSGVLNSILEESSSSSKEIDQTTMRSDDLIKKFEVTTETTALTDESKTDLSFEKSYEIIGPENLFPSCPPSFKGTAIGEKQFSSLFDESGRLNDYKGFKGLIFALVGLPLLNLFL